MYPCLYMHIAWQPTDYATEFIVFSFMYIICKVPKVHA